jgi:hypothetical protein
MHYSVFEKAWPQNERYRKSTGKHKKTPKPGNVSLGGLHKASTNYPETLRNLTLNAYPNSIVGQYTKSLQIIQQGNGMT